MHNGSLQVIALLLEGDIEAWVEMVKVFPWVGYGKFLINIFAYIYNEIDVLSADALELEMLKIYSECISHILLHTWTHQIYCVSRM